MEWKLTAFNKRSCRSGCLSTVGGRNLVEESKKVLAYSHPSAFIPTFPRAALLNAPNPPISTLSIGNLGQWQCIRVLVKSKMVSWRTAAYLVGDHTSAVCTEPSKAPGSSPT